MGGELRSLGEQGCLTPLGDLELSRVLTTVPFHIAGPRKRTRWVGP